MAVCPFCQQSHSLLRHKAQRRSWVLARRLAGFCRNWGLLGLARAIWRRQVGACHGCGLLVGFGTITPAGMFCETCRLESVIGRNQEERFDGDHSARSLPRQH